MTEINEQQLITFMNEMNVLKNKIKHIQNVQSSDIQKSKEAIKELLAERFLTREQAVILSDPQRLLGTIRTVLQNELRFELRRMIKEEFDPVLNQARIDFGLRSNLYIKESLKEKLKKVNIDFLVRDYLTEQFKNDFSPVIRKCLQLSVGCVQNRIQKQLKNIINLKTSTIMEIKSEVSKILPEKEEEALLQLENFSGDKKYIKYFEEMERNHV